MEFAHGVLWTIFLSGMVAAFLHSYIFQNHVESRRKRFTELQQKIFEAQRKGDIRLAGELSLEADKLEKEIINESKNNEA
jgi:hypothetical protein